jgi:hypothetical protein
MLKLFFKSLRRNFTKTNIIPKEPDQMVEYSKEIKDKYASLINQHYDSHLPYTNKEYYSQLFYFSSSIPHSNGLQSWDILFNYIKYNIDILDKEFLIDALQQYSRLNYENFEFWYYVEKRLTKEIRSFSNKELAIVTYSFGHVRQGSDHIFTLLGREVLDRGIRNFSENEFIMIYNGLKNSGIRDKLLWAILNKAKEIFPDIQEERIS